MTTACIDARHRLFCRIHYSKPNGFHHIIIGYFSLSTPTYLLNGADVLIIKTLRKALGFKRDITTFQDASIPARRKALQSLILSLSDQQIVVSAAMLVASYARHSTITTYSVDVTTSLAFLSPGVHLQTLDIVRYKLQPKTAAKNIKVVFMLGTMAMLIFTSTLQSSKFWNDNVFFFCGLSSFTVKGAESALVFQTLQNLVLICAFLNAVIGLHSKEDRLGKSFDDMAL